MLSYLWCVAALVGLLPWIYNGVTPADRATGEHGAGAEADDGVPARFAPPHGESDAGVVCMVDVMGVGNCGSVFLGGLFAKLGP